MANKRKTMSKIKQIIRLYQSGTSKRTIACKTGISRNTVKKYLHLVKSRGYSYEEFLKLDDQSIDEVLKEEHPMGKERLSNLEAFLPYMEKELRRTGVNRWVLWEEYKRKHPAGYSYGQFCHHYQQWSKYTDSCMHFEHKAGDKVFVDYAGKKLQIVDKQTGEIKSVEVFVAILGASQLTYVEASYSQQLEDFIGSMQSALIYFEGVPAAIVPDNLKSAVTKSNKYEPMLNEHFADFGFHYDTHILATRSYKPRDKAMVEKAVSIVYSRIYAPLRNRTFYSLSELNQAIKELLEAYNTVKFKSRDHSRRDLFNSLEKQALKPLPKEAYQIKHYTLATVQKNSHVYLSKDKHYYSAPFRFTGKKVKICYTKSKVEIYNNYQRIAIHQRDRKPYGYTTIKEHMPTAHQFVSEWNPDKFINWAKAYGQSVHEYIIRVLDNHQHPEQNYKSCIGILSLEKKYSKHRLNQACKRGLYYNNYSYRVIKNILERGLEQFKEELVQCHIPFHDNIRGEQYYH